MKIFKTELQFVGGEYVRPNEKNPLVYKDILANRTGLLISVGTFRTLVAFALGNFKKLIMVDVDSRVLAFNRKHLDDIKEIRNIDDDLAKQRSAYYERYKEFLGSYNDLASADYYWNNDKGWRKIIEAINKNNIHVIQGDLANQKSLSALSRILYQSFGNTDRTLDISNITEYFTDKGELGVSGLLDAISVFYSKKKEDSNDILLMTLNKSGPPLSLVMNGPKLLAAEDWYYYYFNLRDYVDYFEYMQLRKDFKKLQESIK